MNKILDRMTGMDIFPADAAYSISNQDLVTAISEYVDLETVTNHELREIFFIVKKSLFWMDWRSTVSNAVDRLPFGLNQTSIAWSGAFPCTDCPDGMIEDDQCYHKYACKAWEIYHTRL